MNLNFYWYLQNSSTRYTSLRALSRSQTPCSKVSHILGQGTSSTSWTIQPCVTLRKQYSSKQDTKSLYTARAILHESHMHRRHPVQRGAAYRCTWTGAWGSLLSLLPCLLHLGYPWAPRGHQNLLSRGYHGRRGRTEILSASKKRGWDMVQWIQQNKLFSSSNIEATQ
jgi:hypothetical protein